MPATKRLAEREFMLIQEIAKGSHHTQRSLSQSIGLSLGTTNLLIQRLARKGLIKVNQLDWKRTQYILTLKGAVEKTSKVYNYTLYTIRLFRQLQDNIAAVIAREYAAGRREFHCVAQDELLELLRDEVRRQDLRGARFAFHRAYAEVPPGADLVLGATLEAPPPPQPGRRYQSLVDFDNIRVRVS